MGITIIVDANPIISALIGGISKDILFALSLLPLKVYSEIQYNGKIKEAKELIEYRDREDVPILALTLTLNVPLWSMDKDFEDIDQIKLLKTKDFI